MTSPSRTRPQVTAAERPFEDWISRQSTVRLSCRINGHWWPGYALDGHSRLGTVAPPAAGHRRLGVYQLSMQCLREINGETCGVSRRAYFEHTYVPAVNVYNYPLGYMTPEGCYLNRKRRGRLRRELDIRAGEGE
jgi:hypothetical protein